MDSSRLVTLNARVATLRGQLQSGSTFRYWEPDVFYYMFVLVGAALFALAFVLAGAGSQNWAIVVTGVVLGFLCLMPPRLKNRLRYWARIDLPNHRLQSQIAPLLAEIGRLRGAIVRDLESLVEPVTGADSEYPLHWTCRTVSDLAVDLNLLGHAVSDLAVAELLVELGYSFPGNAGTGEGGSESERHARFERINREVLRFLADSQPVFSIDTRQGILVRDIRNCGTKSSLSTDPDAARVRDFLTRELGRDTPFGVNELAQNSDGANAVDMPHDTAAFVVESIGRWWQSVGRGVYPYAHRLLIVAGAGGNNTPRVRLGKAELQKLADMTGLRIAVCHFPPGASKWNETQHRLFGITQNEPRGAVPPYQVLVDLIAAAPTGKDPTANAEEDGVPADATGIGRQATTCVRPIDTLSWDWSYEIAPRPVQSDGSLFHSG